MFTRKVYEMQAKLLGTHSIPMCIVPGFWLDDVPWLWDSTAISEFHRMGNWLVDMFREDNPNFDVHKFNSAILSHGFHVMTNTAWEHLIPDLPGFRVSGRKDPPNDWVFRTVHIEYPVK